MKEGSVGAFLEICNNPFKMVFVHEDDTIAEVLKKMLKYEEERLVCVLDAKERLKGVISVGKLIRHLFNEEITPENGFTPSANILHYLTAECAKDIMDTDVVSCTMDESLESAKAKMLSKRTKKIIPVVDEQMHVINVLNIVSLMELKLNSEECSS